MFPWPSSLAQKESQSLVQKRVVVPAKQAAVGAIGVSGPHDEVVRPNAHFTFHVVAFSIPVSGFTFIVPEDQIPQTVGRAIGGAAPLSNLTFNPLRFQVSCPNDECSATGTRLSNGARLSSA